MAESVDCLAELEFDQNRLAKITSLAGGVVKSVEVDLGSRIDRGDLLATVASAAIGEAQGSYLQALAVLLGKKSRHWVRAPNIASVLRFTRAMNTPSCLLKS